MAVITAYIGCYEEDNVNNFDMKNWNYKALNTFLELWIIFIYPVILKRFIILLLKYKNERKNTISVNFFLVILKRWQKHHVSFNRSNFRAANL